MIKGLGGIERAHNSEWHGDDGQGWVHFLLDLKNEGSSSEATGSQETEKRRWLFMQRIHCSVKLLGKGCFGYEKFNWLKGRVAQHLHG